MFEIEDVCMNETFIHWKCDDCNQKFSLVAESYIDNLKEQLELIKISHKELSDKIYLINKRFEEE